MSRRTAYPLDWPVDWPRTSRRKRSSFAAVSFNRARILVKDELRRMKASDVTLSTNRQLRADGEPWSGRREPDDTAVAVYFTWRSHPHVMACDTYRHDWENMKAIAASIEALRKLERHGASPLLERAMGGFSALPAEGQSTNRFMEVFERIRTPEEAVYERRRLIAEHHPDRGGSAEEVIMISEAFDAFWEK